MSALVKLFASFRLKFLQPPENFLLSKTYISHTIETDSFKLYELDKGPSSDIILSPEDALAYYKQMYRIRTMENTCAQLYMQKLLRGFVHLYAGEEACAVGINAVMQPNDTVITSYRCHGWALTMGESMDVLIAELMGKVTGKILLSSLHQYPYNLLWCRNCNV